MTFFENLTASLKQQWLYFYQANRSWIGRQMEVESVETPDGGKRPSSYLILGVVSALEPQLAELMMPFTKLNPDINALIDVLELNFDPSLFQSHSLTATASSDDSMDLLLEIPNEVADEVLVLEDDESVVVMSVTQMDMSENSSLEEIANDPTHARSDLESYEMSSATQPEFGEVLVDEWNQGTSSEAEPVNDPNRSREEKGPEDEISRLFPNF